METSAVIVATPEGISPFEVSLDKVVVLNVDNLRTSDRNTCFFMSTTKNCREELLSDIVYDLRRFEILSYPWNNIGIRLETFVKTDEKTRPYLDTIFGKINSHRTFTWTYDDEEGSTRLNMYHDYFNVSLVSFLLYFVKYNRELFSPLKLSGYVNENSEWERILRRIIQWDSYDGRYYAFALYELLFEGNISFLLAFDNNYGGSVSGIAEASIGKLNRGNYLGHLQNFNKLVGLNNNSYDGQIGYLLEISDLLGYDQYRQDKIRRQYE